MLKFVEDLLQGAPVEWKTLGEILAYEQPAKYIVHSSKYKDYHPTPVLTAGQSFILGYTNETDGIYDASPQKPVIIFDDFTTSFHWVDFPFKVKSSAMKFLSPIDATSINFRFVFYAMCCIRREIIGHQRQWIANFSMQNIPLPPLPVQEKIVEILDKFIELEAKLGTELVLRQKQYEYYRNKLLTFGEEVEWRQLGEIGEIRMCKRIMKNQTSASGEIPFYKIGTFGKEADAYISRELFSEYKSKYNYPRAGDILISASGTIGRVVLFDGEDAYFQDSNIVWIENEEKKVLNKYLFYCYQIAKWNISEGGTIQRLYNSDLKKTLIPIPYPNDIERSLSEQARIVSILDKFHTLANSLTDGLPREIALRHKQYEYYRDQLFAFPRPQ